jgi:hypothetical protein
MAALKQNTDGSVSIMRETDGQELFRAGGPPAVGATAPAFLPGSTLKLPVAGPTDTAGGLLAWQNNLGYDIVVYGATLDVTTQSGGACTGSVGAAANGTTLNAGMISGQSAAATGQFAKATPMAQKVPAGQFITASTASGASSGLVAKLYVEYCPA